MGKFNQLQDIIQDIKGMINVSVKDENVERRQLIKLLKFIDKMVQLVDQSFENVQKVLVSIKYLKEKDLDSDRFTDLQKEVDLLVSNKFFKETEQICARLHLLSDQFNIEISPIIDQLKEQSEWSSIYRIIDEHEGAIINIIRDSIQTIQSKLSQVTPEKLPALNQLAVEMSNELKVCLDELRKLRDQLVGSSEIGVLELVEQSENEIPRNEIIFHLENVTGGDHFSNISNSNIVNRSTINTDNINSLMKNQDSNSPQLKEELKSFVVKGNLTGFFEKIIAYLKSKNKKKEINDILTISSKVSMIENAKNLGTMSSNEFDIEMTKINKGLLHFADLYLAD